MNISAITKRSDNELVEQCLKGDSQAFNYLVERYEVQMYRTALGIVNDVELAKDITQTGFLKSWQKLHSYNSEYKFYSWLYRIIVNESLNRVRGKDNHLSFNGQLSNEDTPYQQMVKKEENRTLLNCLESLPVDYRVVIQLRHFEELSYKEIAESLDIEIKTVKSRLYTARMQLREKLFER